MKKIYKLDNGKWIKVRMMELREGDYFLVDSKIYQASRSPRMVNGVAEVEVL